MLIVPFTMARAQPQERPTAQQMCERLEQALQDLQSHQATTVLPPKASSVIVTLPPPLPVLTSPPVTAVQQPEGGKGEIVRPNNRSFWARLFCLPPSK